MGGREGAWPLHHVRRKSSRRACPRVVPAAVDLRPAGRESRESNGPNSASLCRWRIAWDWISWASIPGRPLLSGAAVTFRGGRYFPGRPLLSGTAVAARGGPGYTAGPARYGAALIHEPLSALLAFKSRQAQNGFNLLRSYTL